MQKSSKSRAATPHETCENSCVKIHAGCTIRIRWGRTAPRECALSSGLPFLIYGSRRIQDFGCRARWVLEQEAMGSKDKFWYRAKHGEPEWLFKYPQDNTGQDWAEKSRLRSRLAWEFFTQSWSSRPSREKWVPPLSPSRGTGASYFTAINSWPARLSVMIRERNFARGIIPSRTFFWP